MNQIQPHSTRSARWRPPLANLGLAASSVVLVLLLWLLAEAALRVLDPRYLDRFGLDDINYLHVYSESYGWVPRRGFRLKLGQGPETTINAAGYRGHEYPYARTAAQTRVVMLGDSIAFGYGVADEETSSSWLERLDRKLEVINLAVQGYGTDQALLRFEREGLRFQPDVAILNFCIANDFRDNGARRAISDGVYPKPYFALEGDRLVLHEEHLKLSPIDRFALFLHQRSIVFHELRRLARLATGEDAAVPAEHPPARDLTIALLNRLAKVARAQRVRLVVAIYPNYREFLAPTRRPRLILEAAGLEDVLRADLRPLLNARGVSAQTYWEYSLDTNFHLNARGNRVVAEILLDLLRRSQAAHALSARSARNCVASASC